MRFLLWAVMLAAGLASCRKAPVAEPPVAAEIGIRPSAPGTGTKALTAWTDANLTDAELRIDAYLSGTTTAFLEGTCYKYIGVFSDWRFYDLVGDNILHYYWPVAGSYTGGHDTRLDFVGYLPYDAADLVPDTGVTIGSYIAGDPNFTVSMPEFASRDTQVEFLYAFTADQTRETNSGTVDMNFLHPFASVYFVLNTAPRGTVINSITLENIYKDGTFHHADTPQWSSPDNLGDYAVTGIDKRVPNQLNYRQTIGGPYFVMPQALDHQTASEYDVRIVVGWTDKDSVSHTSTGVIGSDSAKWLPGYAYSYSLTVGDRSDDGIVDVTVTAWSVEGTSTSEID